jgi:hypothetical protein
MSEDTKGVKPERRVTRSKYNTADDLQLFNTNYIDSFYTKKKKANPKGKNYFLLFDNLGNDKYDSNKGTKFQIPLTKGLIQDNEDNSLSCK